MPGRRAPSDPYPLRDQAAPERFGPGVAIADEVVARLAGACAEVTVDDADRTAAGRDWWPLSMTWAEAGHVPARPAVVARPASTAEVAAVLEIASLAGVPVTPAAGRSGVCGGAVPVFGGVSLDLTALAGVVDVDATSLLVDVAAGTFGDALEDTMRSEHRLTTGHWPQSIALSTVGGWAACRSAGQYSTRYGKIEDMVAGLEVVLADGAVIRTGGLGPRSATGPDLTQLFVGSEGTLGVVTEVRLRVHPAPADERRAAYGFASFAEGIDACRRVLRRGATPAVLRLYDERESRRSFDVERGCALIVLDEGDPALLDATMAIVADECGSASTLEPALVERWLRHRNDVTALGEAIARGVVVDTCEVAAPWSKLADLYAATVAAVREVDGAWVVSAHLSHSYADGACVYFTFAGQRDDPDAFYVDAWDALTRAALGHGAAISHHHGIGLNRARFLPDALGTAFAPLVAIKRALDPAGILNPGKLALPSPFGPQVPWPASSRGAGA